MNRVRGLSCRALLGTASAGAIVALLTMPALTQTRPQAPKIGDPPEALNMRLVGHNDLQARTAYQPTIFKQGGRYIAYVGHHGGSKENPAPRNALTGQDELNGTSILDVTDPEAAEISRTHSGRGRRRRGRRVADDARVRRQDARQGRSQPGLSAAHLRTRRP